MEFKTATKEKILFLEKTALELVSYIFDEEDFKESLITDESTLSDFRMFNPKNAIKIDGDKYHFEFTMWDSKSAIKKYKKPWFELSKTEKDEFKTTKNKIILKKEMIFDKEIIDMVEKKYKVSLTEEELYLPLYELAFKINKKRAIE